MLKIVLLANIFGTTLINVVSYYFGVLTVVLVQLGLGVSMFSSSALEYLHRSMYVMVNPKYP